MSITIDHIDAVSDEFLKVFDAVCFNASGLIDSSAFERFRRLIAGCNVLCLARAKQKRAQRMARQSKQVKDQGHLGRFSPQGQGRPVTFDIFERHQRRSRVTELTMDVKFNGGRAIVKRLPVVSKHHEQLSPRGLWLYRLKRKRLLSLQFSDIDTDQRGVIASEQLLEALGLTNIGQFKLQ